MGKKIVDTETVIDPDLTPQPEPEKKKRRSKMDDVSFEEAQANLTRAFNAISSLVKSGKQYKESEFVEEAKDLSRLAKKYDIVNAVLTALAPLFLVLGLFTKVRELMDAREKKKEKAKNGEADSNTDNGGAAGYDGIRAIK